MSSASAGAGGVPASYSEILEKVIQKQNFLEKALLNSRVRKPIDYTRHYRADMRCPFEPGDIIMVEPAATFGAYEVKEDLVPGVVTKQKIHLTPDYTQSLGALAASPGSYTSTMLQFNLNIDEIGIYKIIPEDFGYRIEINQPGTVTRFGNKTGSWNLAGADMVETWNKGYFGLIPEIMVFEDRTPITIKAVSTDPNTTINSFFRVSIFGYQLPITKLPPDSTVTRSDPRVVANIWVGTPAK